MNLMNRIRQSADGKYWLIDGDTHTTRWVEERGRLDYDRGIDRLLQYIPAGGVCVDAGASVGDHTISYARKVGPEGLVMAFEPNVAPFVCMVMNLREYPQVTPFNCGLGWELAQLRFNIDPANVGASRFVEHGSNSDIVVASLDYWSDMIDRHGRFDLFKLDVEGMELDAICGARGLIEKYKPVLFFEINKGVLESLKLSPEKILAYVSNLGYAVENAGPGKPDDFSGPQFDVLCRPNKL